MLTEVFMHKNKERKKKTKRKYQTELLERIVTKTFFLIHHDLLNVQTFTDWKPDASKIFITGRTSNCSFTVMSETDMWNMETKNQYRNDNLPIVTSHSSNWTFHWWSNDRTVILASFHRGRGVQIRIMCKTIHMITFISMKTELIPMDCVHKCSGHMHCSHPSTGIADRSRASYLLGVVVLHLTLPYSSSWLAWLLNC